MVTVFSEYLCEIVTFVWAGTKYGCEIGIIAPNSAFNFIIVFRVISTPFITVITNGESLSNDSSC